MTGIIQPVRASPSELEAMIRQAFGGEARIAREISLGGGQINDTRMIALADGQRYVLRVAPSDATAANGPSWFASHGLRREQAVIAAASELAAYLPVTIAHDFGQAAIERDWVIQEVMPGKPLADIEGALTERDLAGIWEQVGEFTCRLHGHTGRHFGPPLWGPSFERWSGLLANDVDGFIVDAGNFSLPPRPFERLREAVDELGAVLDEVGTPSLIHSDLSPSHIIVAEDDSGNLGVSGFIDLEFGRFADPLSESLFSWFQQARGQRESASAFLRGYGRSAYSENERMRLFLYVAVSLGWWATLLAYQERPVAGVMRELENALERLALS